MKNFNLKNTTAVLVLACILVCKHNIHAQGASNAYPVVINPTMAYAPYSVYVSDFADRAYPMLKPMVTFKDANETSINVYLRIVVQSNKVRLSNAIDFRPSRPVTLFPNQPYTFSPDELEEYFLPQNINPEGITNEQLQQNARLPEGLYSFTIEVFDWQSQKPISGKISQQLWLVLKDPPRVISPQCGVYIKPMEVQNIPFTWQHANAFSPNSQGTEYQLTVEEITDTTIGDTRSAIQNAKTLPIWQTTKALNKYTEIMDVAAPALDLGKAYAFRIQASEVSGKDVYKNDGYSEVCWFYYGYPANRKIELKSPIAAFQYKRIEKPTFKFKAPDKSIATQKFSYTLKVVVKDSAQEPADAMLKNEIWHTQDFLSYDPNDMTVRIDKALEPNKNYAWQVTCNSDGQVVAKSPVWWFKGPPVLEVLDAGPHKVYITSTSTTDLNNLAGKGYLLINGDTLKVDFQNLRVSDFGGQYILEGGSIRKSFNPGFNIEIAPKQPRNPVANFNYTELKLDKVGMNLLGHLRYPLPFPVQNGEKNYIKSQNEWVNYDRLKVATTLRAEGIQKFKLLDPLDFELTVDSSTVFFLFDNKYENFHTGSFTLTPEVKTEQSTPVVYPYYRHSNISYLTPNVVNPASNILLIRNTGMVLQPDSVLIDMDEETSPAGLEPGWKGAYFPKFKMLYRTKIDEFAQVQLLKEISQSFSQNSETQTKKGNNQAIVARVSGRGITADLSPTFASQDSIKFNTYPAVPKQMYVHISNNVVSDSRWEGNMLVPVISPKKTFPYTIPLTSEGFIDGYMQEMEGYNFTMNAGKGDRELDITVHRAVFVEKDRLAINLTLDWKGVGVTLAQQGGFFAWGNYRIGFGEPDGAIAINGQMQGTVSKYPFNVEGIGAGSSGGAYSFALTGKLNGGEDMAGEKGPPSTNVYSIEPNSWARKEQGQGEQLENVTKNTSGGEETAQVPQQPAPETIDESELAANAAAGIEAAEAAKKNVSGEVTTSYSGNFKVDEKKINETVDKLKDAAEKKIDETVDKLKDATWGYLLTQLQKNVDKRWLTAVTNYLNNKFNPVQLLQNKLDTLSLKLTTKIDSLSVKAENLVGNGVVAVIRPIKNNVKKLAKKPEMIAAIDRIANEVQDETVNQVKSAIKKSIKDNIRDPLEKTLTVDIKAKLETIVKEEIGNIGFNAETGEAELELELNIGHALERVIKEALSTLDPKKIGDAAVNTGKDAINNIDTKAISDRLSKAIIAEGSKALGKYVASKALGKAGGELLKKLPIRMDQLGDRLMAGDVKGMLLALDPMEVKMNTKFMSLQGWIKFTPDDPTYGNVWRGDVNLSVNVPKKISFVGTYMGGKKDGTDYWFCQLRGGGDEKKALSNNSVKKEESPPQMGGALSKDVGVLDNPVNLGVAKVVGLTGRLWHHMREDEGKGIVPDITADKGAFVRFVIFDGGTDGKTFRMDLAAGIQLDATGDYEVDFKGDAQFMSISPTVKAPDPNAGVKADIRLFYNSKEQHMLAQLGIEIKNAGVCAAGTMEIETKPGYWHVYIGDEPLNKRIRITPACAGWGGQGWFKIDQRIIEIGLAVSFGAKGKVGIDIGIFGVAVTYDVGAAAGVKAEFQYNPSFQLNKAGIFIDIWGELGVCVKAFLVIDACVTLVKVGLHGELMVVFNPPPSYVEGKLNGFFEVFGGLLSFNFDAKIKKNL